MSEQQKMDQERAAFEAWVIPAWSMEKRTDSDGDTVYVEDWVQGAWICWQARASLPVGVPDDPRDIQGDTGHSDVDRLIGRLTSADPDFNDCAEAAALLRRLVAEEINGPDGYATWRDAALAERMRRVALKPDDAIVQIARDGIDVYPGPNMNERKVCAEIIRLAEAYTAPAAQPAAEQSAPGEVEEVEVVGILSRGPHDEPLCTFTGNPDMHIKDGDQLMTVAQHKRIVAQLAVRDAGEVRVPTALVRESIRLLDYQPACSAESDCADELRALLAQREREGE